MRNRQRGLAVVLAVAGMAAGRMAVGAPPAAAGDKAYWEAYDRGLMALRAGDWAGAGAALSEAIKRSPDPRAYLARGVANALQEKFDQAYADLSHATIPAEAGKRPSREAELWRLCIWAMSDKVPENAQNMGGGTNWYSGIPGNMVQGGDDYPTDYASVVAYEMTTPYRNARTGGKDVHAPAIVAAMKKAGQWFANRWLATGPMAAFNFEYARGLLAKGDAVGALDAINLVTAVYPFDADVRLVVAEGNRMLGRVETARREYTVVLTMRTDMAAGYRGRALAAAAEGDARRALEDLRWAKTYDSKMAEDLPQQVAEALAKNPIAGTPVKLLAKLDEMANVEGTEIEKLMPVAVDLERAAAAQRVRYDEMYQERVRLLEQATRDQPQNADAYVAFAAYLLDELENRGETVEPRRGETEFRFQYSQEMEVSRAIFALNQALKINSRHAGALVRMAFAYDALGEKDKAENYVTQALELGGAKNADAVRLLAQYRAQEAGSMMARATRLRTPRFVSNSHTENRSDGVYQVTTTTRFDPTPLDLQQAGELEEEARATIAQAKSLMEQAIKLDPNSLEGMLLQAAYQNWFGTQEQALAIYQAAVKKYPQALKARDAVTDFYLAHGMQDEAIEAQMAAAPLYQTTAWPVLGRIWRDVQVNGWPVLMKDVARAREADPANARGTAYLAAAQWDDKETKASLASAREAIALELARLQVDDQGAGTKMPRNSTDFALVMHLLSHLGVHEAQGGDVDKGIRDAQRAAELGPRFGPGGMGQLMFGAMLPDAHVAQGTVPAPVNGGTEAAETYVAVGELLKAKNDNKGALRWFGAAVALARPHNSNIPMVGNAKGQTNFSEFATGPLLTQAWMEIAKADVALGDNKSAVEALNNAGQTGPTRDQAMEINTMMITAARLATEQMQREEQQQQGPAPQNWMEQQQQWQQQNPDRQRQIQQQQLQQQQLQQQLRQSGR